MYKCIGSYHPCPELPSQELSNEHCRALSSYHKNNSNIDVLFWGLISTLAIFLMSYICNHKSRAGFFRHRFSALCYFQHIVLWHKEFDRQGQSRGERKLWLEWQPWQRGQGLRGQFPNFLLLWIETYYSCVFTAGICRLLLVIGCHGTSTRNLAQHSQQLRFSKISPGDLCQLIGLEVSSLEIQKFLQVKFSSARRMKTLLFMIPFPQGKIRLFAGF